MLMKSNGYPLHYLTSDADIFTKMEIPNIFNEEKLLGLTLKRPVFRDKIINVTYVFDRDNDLTRYEVGRVKVSKVLDSVLLKKF